MLPSFFVREVPQGLSYCTRSNKDASLADLVAAESGVSAMSGASAMSGVSAPFSRGVVVARAVLEDIHATRGLEHFKMKLTLASFRIQVDYENAEQQSPPREESCLGCSTAASTMRDLSHLPSWSNTHAEHMNVWLDAQARPMLVVTPVRHVERVVDLTDEELAHFLGCVVDLFQHQIPAHVAPRIIIVNHGNARNIRHLHLKMWFSKSDWAVIRAGWGETVERNWLGLRGGETYSAWRKQDKKILKALEGAGE